MVLTVCYITVYNNRSKCVPLGSMLFRSWTVAPFLMSQEWWRLFDRRTKYVGEVEMNEVRILSVPTDKNIVKIVFKTFCAVLAGIYF